MSEAIRVPTGGASAIDFSPPGTRRRRWLAVLLGLFLVGLALGSTLQPVEIINQRVPHFFIGRLSGLGAPQPESRSRIRVYADESLRSNVGSYMAENHLAYQFVPDASQADIALHSSRDLSESRRRPGAESTADIFVGGERWAAADRGESMSAVLDQILAYPLALPRPSVQDPEQPVISMSAVLDQSLAYPLALPRPSVQDPEQPVITMLRPSRGRDPIIAAGSGGRDPIIAAGHQGRNPRIPPRPSYECEVCCGGGGGGGGGQDGGRRAVLAPLVVGVAFAPLLPDGAILAIAGDDREVFIRIVPALVVVEAGQAQSFDIQVLCEDDRWYSVTRHKEAHFRIIGDPGGIRRHAREKNRFALPLAAKELLHGRRVIIEASYSPVGYETGYARSIIIQQVPGAITTPDTVTR